MRLFSEGIYRMSAAVLLLPLLAGADPSLIVESAKPLPELTQLFRHTRGWTGGDCAASIPLSEKRTLWLFADTWIGVVENGRRQKMRMSNNTAAWQSLETHEPLKFFWAGSEEKPEALLKPTQSDHWYWPGDGVMHDGKLYVFCKLVKRNEAGAPAFQFDWVGNELVQIENPYDEPTRWRYQRMRLFRDEDDVRLGCGCVIDGDHLFVFGLFPKKECKKLEAPVAVARVPLAKLDRRQFSDWQFWTESGWSGKPDKLIALMRDGAAEMSIGRVRGISGLVMVYQGLGLGKDILLRHADRPEGPWSAPVKAYRCPEAGKIFAYAARFHPELAKDPGQLIVTYCRNTGSLADHAREPDIYIPQGVEIRLKAQAK